jgi:hypothetical protein
LQLTAFGARDHGYFEAFLCRAPSAATEAQAVRPVRKETILGRVCNVLRIEAGFGKIAARLTRRALSSSRNLDEG